MAQSASPYAIAEYRRLLGEYQAARGAFDQEAGAYWGAVVEKRRGREMYVSDGARRLLLAGERDRFLNDEWPQILAVIHRLGFSAQELFAQTPAATHPAPPPRGNETTEE